MARYSEEFKYSIVMKMMPPESQPVSKLAKETGLSEATLYKWKKQARAKGLVAPGEEKPERWSTEDKFLIVMETSKLSQAELAEYCRQKGLSVEQIESWRDACRLMEGWPKRQLACKKNCARKSENSNECKEICAVKKRLWLRQQPCWFCILVRRGVLSEQLAKNDQPLVLHSDNSSPMKGASLLETLYTLGITPPRSRSRVSNDNAYAESAFKTCKYHPSYPASGFKDLDHART